MGARPYAWVLVIGDIGRSPRMQYHAISILQQAKVPVLLIGFVRSLDGLRSELLQAHRERKLHLASLPEWYANGGRQSALRDILVQLCK
jgi:hypothetical protein